MENKADYDYDDYIKYNDDDVYIYYKWWDALFNIFYIRICAMAVTSNKSSDYDYVIQLLLMDACAINI